MRSNLKVNVATLLYICVIPIVSFPQNIKSIDDILINSDKRWEKQINGTVMDIEIPSKGDHIYYVTEDDKKFSLHKSTINGDEVWVREWKKEKPYYYVYGLKVSDNGNLVCVHTVDGSEENVRTRVYDGDGNVTFYDTHGGYHMGFYYPSPSGLYLSYEEPNNFSPLEIFNTKGEEQKSFYPEAIKITDTSFLKGERHKHRFVAKDRLLVYEGFKGKGYLYLISVPDGNVLWTYEFDNPLWLIDFNERNCSYTDDYIAIQGTRRPSDLYLFDYSGNLIWKVGGFYSNHAISFSSDGEKVITVDKGHTVVVVDVTSGVISNKLKVEKGGMIGRPQFDMKDNLLFITQSFGFGKVKDELGVKRYFSHIIQLNSDGALKEDSVIRGVHDTKYDSEKSSLTILSSETEKLTISRRVKHVEK